MDMSIRRGWPIVHGLLGGTCTAVLMLVVALGLAASTAVASAEPAVLSAGFYTVLRVLPHFHYWGHPPPYLLSSPTPEYFFPLSTMSAVPYLAYGNPRPDSGMYPPNNSSSFADSSTTIPGKHEFAPGTIRTPSPTPSEAEVLAREGVIDWKLLYSWRFWIRREWLCV
jgi:hypothetical protein